MHLSIKIAAFTVQVDCFDYVRGGKIYKRADRALLAEKQSTKVKIHYAEWPLKTILSGIGGFGSRNYHFKCSPLPTRGPALALDERLSVPLHRVVRLGSREVVGQVWALLFSLSVSVSHLLAPYWRCFSHQSVCAFTSASILILISSVAFSSSLSLRFFAPLPARTPNGPSLIILVPSSRVVSYDSSADSCNTQDAHRHYPSGRVLVIDTANV